MSKLTEWEVGQELIKAHDAIMECAVELKGDSEQYRACLYAAAIIGDVFNKHHSSNSHSFGLAGSEALTPNKETSK